MAQRPGGSGTAVFRSARSPLLQQLHSISKFPVSCPWGFLSFFFFGAIARQSGPWWALPAWVQDSRLARCAALALFCACEAHAQATRPPLQQPPAASCQNRPQNPYLLSSAAERRWTFNLPLVIPTETPQPRSPCFRAKGSPRLHQVHGSFMDPRRMQIVGLTLCIIMPAGLE